MSEATLRKRFQFHLMTIIWLTLIVAAYFAGRIPSEQRATEMVKRAEAKVAKAELFANETRQNADREIRDITLELEAKEMQITTLQVTNIKTAERLYKLEKAQDVEMPSDIRQRVVSDFGQQRADEIYRYLLERIPSGLANGTRKRHLRCILFLAKGDKERLDRYIEMCLRDTRDVMLGAEYETARDSRLVRKRDFNKPFDQAQIQTD